MAFFTSPTYRFFEFILLCVVIPGLIIGLRLAPYMFFFLWSATLYGFLIYRYFHFPGWKEMWGLPAINWSNLKPILLRWVLATAGMLVFLYAYNPDRLFHLQNNAPDVIPYILFMYPLVSALPQEFVFCTFFFARYEKFFPLKWPLIIASAVTFAFAHVLYINPVAPIISFLGGLIFASTFAKTKSLSLVTLEHALYGNSLFLIGLGYYFWSGGVAQ